MNLLEDMNNPLWQSKKCVYCYTNKINGKKYIGQVCSKVNTLSTRHKRHMKGSLLIDKKLREYGEDNFVLEIIHIGYDYKEMNYFESFYIKYYNTIVLNNHGYNISKGQNGNNTLCGKTDEELKIIHKKISEAHKGKKLSEKTKQKIKDNAKNNSNFGMKGKHQPYETVQKMTGENNSRHQTVAQYDDNMNLIKVWKGVKEIERILGINNSSIIQCCKFWEINCDKEEWFKTHKNRPVKKAGGYIWKYYKED